MQNDFDDDLQDIFGEDFGDDELDRQFNVDDFGDDDFPEEEEEAGVNRTFLVAGLLLIGAFAAIVVLIILSISGNDSENAQQTAWFIETANRVQQISFEQEGTRIALEQEALDALTQTAIANTNETLVAAATQTQAAYLLELDRLATQRAVDATSTQAFFDNLATLTATALTPAPTNTPTPVELSGQLSSSADMSSIAGLTIYVYRDDGDQQFSSPPTPTPMPTTTPLPPTASPTFTQAPTIDPSSLSETDITATSAAATRNAEIESFDATATARVQPQTATPEFGEAVASPTLEASEVIETTPTVEDIVTTPEVSTPEADATEIASVPTEEVPLEDETVLVSSGDLQVSLKIPATWLTDDKLSEQGVFFFGDSPDAISTRASFDSETPPPVVGLGGQVVPLTPDVLLEFGVDEVNEELLTDLLSFDLLDISDFGGEIIEEPQTVDLGDGRLAHYVVVQLGNEQGFLGYIGAGTVLAQVSITATTEEFEENRDLLLSIFGSVNAPLTEGEESLTPAPTASEEELNPPATQENTAPVGGLSAQPNMFFQVRADEGVRLYQDGSTPVPPGQDDLVATAVILPDGTFSVTLPAEPGIYYMVVDLPPGDYSILIEGQTEVFSIPEDLPFGEVVETRIVIADRTFILRTGRAATGGPVVTPTIDQNLSPFLQTATAAAPRDLASPTAGPTAIPSAGGADLLGGNSAQNLTVLAMIGAALVGLAFVVRRMRSTLSI